MRERQDDEPINSAQEENPVEPTDLSDPSRDNTINDDLNQDSAPESTDDINEAVELPLAASFDELFEDPLLRQKIAGLGFSAPMPVQAKTIPVALSGRDALVQAQTGSGKTLAFVLPALVQLARSEKNGPVRDTFALIVSPTRELALQITEVIRSVCDSLKPVCIIGGVSIDGQINELKNDPRIVVGTPGRILDLIRQKALRLKTCRYFVLDEADEMLSMGFLEDVRAILSRLPDRRQGLFVSATITPRVEMLASSFLTRPVSVVLTSAKQDLPPIEHFYCDVGGDIMAKPTALCDLIETFRPASAIIFCNTKSDTQLVEVLLRRRGFDARQINSDLTQAKRDRIMKKIRNQELQFLVATDIAGRGLDIDQIDLVVNYSIHEQPEIYIHRTGRTGRAGRVGKAISLVGPKDFGSFHFLTKVLNVQFKKMPLPTDEDVANAQLAHLYEVVRQTNVEVQDRHLLVTRMLLKELGGIEDPAEELETMVSKLYRFSVEHFLKQEIKSLDEELDSAAGDAAPPQRQDRSRGERDRGRERDRGEHRRDREFSSGRDSGRERGRDNRRSRDDRSRERGGRDRRDYNEERQVRENEREAQAAEHRRRARLEEERAEHSPAPNAAAAIEETAAVTPAVQEPAPEGFTLPGSLDDEYRCYIGQGLEQGMTPELFTDLVVELAEIAPGDLRHLTIRECYGYVDLNGEKALALLNNLNGIDYNGQLLQLEIACAFTQRRQYDQRRGGGESYRRNDRREGRRDNRRGGRNDYDRGGRRDNRRDHGRRDRRWD